MPRDPEKYLSDILDGCHFLAGFTAGKTLQEYRADRGFRSAVERELQVIGEALMVLARLAPHLAERVSEYQRIIRFRHTLVHGYAELDHEIVRALLQLKLPILSAESEELLREK